MSEPTSWAERMMAAESKLSSRTLKKWTLVAIVALTMLIPAYAVWGQEFVRSDVSISMDMCTNGTADPIADLTSFYQTIFGLLIAALGLVVALAYLTIRAVSREAAVKTVQDEVNRYFTRDKPFLDSIQMQISSQMGDALAESGLPEQMAQLDTRTSTLEARTAGLQEQEGMLNGGAAVVREGED